MKFDTLLFVHFLMHLLWHIILLLKITHHSKNFGILAESHPPLPISQIVARPQKWTMVCIWRFEKKKSSSERKSQSQG